MKKLILDAISQNGRSDFNIFLKKGVSEEISLLLAELLVEKKVEFQALQADFEDEEKRAVLLMLDADELWERIALEKQWNALNVLWSLVNHFHQVGLGEGFREIIEAFQQELVAFEDEVAYSKWYYELMKLASKREGWTEDQVRIFSLRLQEAEHRGIALDDHAQSELKKINLELSKISDQIQNNVVDDQKEFRYVIEDMSVLRLLPKQSIMQIELNKQEDGNYFLDANPSVLSDVLRYCEDAKIRKDVYFVQQQRASKGKYSNKNLILDLLKLKEQKAKILGYENFSTYQLALRMAKRPERAKAMIAQVFAKAYPKAQAEIEHIKMHYGLDQLNVRDVFYYMRKYKEEVFALDERKLQEYFEFDQVMSWIKGFVKEFFGIELRKVADEGYGSRYEVYEGENLISYFLLDAFYRNGKRPGAWADLLRVRSKAELPIVVNVCNFQQGEVGSCLLKFRDVETLFHEFWHALHAMLAKSPYAELNGFNVEWDFVELPSQLLERRVSDPISLKTLWKHYQSGEAMSDELIAKVQASANFMKAYWALRQNELGMLDLTLYGGSAPKSIEELDQKVLEIVNQYSIFLRDENYQMYCAFLHIFGGGYAAGYYSYMRAEALEADVFSKIKGIWLFSPDAGSSYKEKILEQGCRKSAEELFFDFMGRELDFSALMKKYGLESGF